LRKIGEEGPVEELIMLNLALLPESTGWMPLRRMVRASRTEIPSTASITASLDVNSIASLSWKISASELIKRQIRNDVVVDTIVANFAARPLLAPSSLATLTLVTIQEHSVSQLNSF
jgi:hypothetical protein